MRNIAIFCCICLFACAPKQESKELAKTAEQKPETPALPELLQKALEAHGGLDKWQTSQGLQYQLINDKSGKVETHKVNLNNRWVRIDGPDYQIGFDGQEVWSYPSIEATGNNSPRFYHNLFFYFFSIPYVLADPGINYEDLGTTEIMGQSYRALKVSFNDGVGDADEDLYIAHFNPETLQLELLLYTVTYYTGEKHENYNALYYKDYKNASGLLFPGKLVGHKYDSGQIKEVRYEFSFEDISLVEESFADSLFLMPKGAEIDSLK